ncbi:MAG: prepilin-type N-terminal cleavage/methylation domain-containing protein [Planctomycetaceae bacterium]|nr:prepilin-type N-terminal cleavage/methylation domain-containing protein [Planctomycetaceae bacterium]
MTTKKGAVIRGQGAGLLYSCPMTTVPCPLLCPTHERLPQKFRRFGFTLLELLIATSLLVVLLGFVWGLTQMFSKSFVRGNMRAERSQLVRSISQLITDDLGCAIQDPLHPNRPGEEATASGNTVRHFGLSGNSTSIRLDIVQINPFRADIADNAQVPELKTVYYEFALLSPDGWNGLTRRELDFETPTRQAVIPATAITTTVMPAAQEQQRQLVMSAPEVVGCRFRYHDGSQWRDSWNSLENKALPVAIEATLQLMPDSEAETLRQSRMVSSVDVRSNVPGETESGIQTAWPQGNISGGSPNAFDETPAETAVGSGIAPTMGSIGGTQPTAGSLVASSAPTAGGLMSDESMAASFPPSNGTQRNAGKPNINVVSAAQQLGLSEPVEQRVVIRVPTTPLQNQRELRREQSQKTKTANAGSHPTLPDVLSLPAPPPVTMPSQQSSGNPSPSGPDWIRN